MATMPGTSAAPQGPASVPAPAQAALSTQALITAKPFYAHRHDPPTRWVLADNLMPL